MKKIELVAKAQARYIRVSSRKVRLVIDLVRGENAVKALAILASLNKGATKYVEKALRSAMSNAKQIPTVRPEELFISKITADNGPMLKRFRAAAMGRATMIRHRMTHLTIELSKLEGKKVKHKLTASQESKGRVFRVKRG